MVDTNSCTLERFRFYEIARDESQQVNNLEYQACVFPHAELNAFRDSFVNSSEDQALKRLIGSYVLDAYNYTKSAENNAERVYFKDDFELIKNDFWEMYERVLLHEVQERTVYVHFDLSPNLHKKINAEFKNRVVNVARKHFEDYDNVKWVAKKPKGDHVYVRITDKDKFDFLKEEPWRLESFFRSCTRSGYPKSMWDEVYERAVTRMDMSARLAFVQQYFDFAGMRNIALPAITVRRGGVGLYERFGVSSANAQVRIDFLLGGTLKKNPPTKRSDARALLKGQELPPLWVRLGFTLAHELGHVSGLQHNKEDPCSLMAKKAATLFCDDVLNVGWTVEEEEYLDYMYLDFFSGFIFIDQFFNLK